ncbi:hypothetical protein OQJ18_00775 [Fluoribacter dumoffii]|uniref:hypothetical protein n=1 Tax=Fluoribacter dumoffii TaxID=463 RepID=UPI002244991B|nr:hypothetical protein [Fluoribacter dumoffii]MCW8419349.1 hypothetical protein [Fluoribacter dumoffii]MCW8452776.1 hypothetical protein [Fluoribacter dumoffii]MCW8459974.1 hypothetical protein [Fluoribacter dumoffii]MCW8483452.1 hypothetical protein [Fluoribacter dumoffii]
MMKRIFVADQTIRHKSPAFKITSPQTLSLNRLFSTSMRPQKTEATPTNFTKHPDPLFFKKLKVEEHKQFTIKKRMRFDYKDNYTAALNLPYSNYLLALKNKDHNALLVLSKENIIEHSNRRVDFLFYTLVAYYKTGILPTFGHTSLQHGKGRTTRKNTNISEACHSSLMPALLDKTIYQNGKTGEKHKSLLSGTHLMDSLNSTVELPPFVNDFDDLLENLCREKSLNILHKVSAGTLNPITGLTQFLQIISGVLKKLAEDANRKSQSCLPQCSLMKPQFNPKLIELVRTGTLATTFSFQTQTASDAYIQLLLRMTPAEKVLCKGNRNKEKMYLDKIMELQQEILESKSSKCHSP